MKKYIVICILIIIPFSIFIFLKYNKFPTSKKNYTSSTTSEQRNIRTTLHLSSKLKEYYYNGEVRYNSFPIEQITLSLPQGFSLSDKKEESPRLINSPDQQGLQIDINRDGSNFGVLYLSKPLENTILLANKEDSGLTDVYVKNFSEYNSMMMRNKDKTILVNFSTSKDVKLESKDKELIKQVLESIDLNKKPTK